MSDQKNSLVSNIEPPSALPTFILQETSENPQNETEKSEKDDTKTSASEEAAPTVQQDIASALSPITEGVKNSVIFGWMKDTVKSGMKTGVQKAKDSIDLVVATLDPQMSALIYSGGETEIVVASSNDDKISSIREAFQNTFGRATVYGHQTQPNSVANQPVGFENAELAAKERINNLRASNETFADKVLVAVENFVVELYKNQWFDVGLLLLSDPQRSITLKSFTQMTFIPQSVISSLEETTPKDDDKRNTGFTQTVGSVMSRKLNTRHFEWHKVYTGVDRFDMILSAAKALASIYKLELQTKEILSKKTETS